MAESTRKLPLFPLPNVVHFPATDLRLHIFEPRYRQLVSDLEAMPGPERLIGMATLKPGWKESSQNAPAVYQPGTAGLLVKLDYLPDGRSNIVLRGQYRFAIEREFPSHPYRQAVVSPMQDQRVPEKVPEVAELRDELRQLLQTLRSRIGRSFPVGLDDNEGRDLTLTELVNTVAAGLDVPPENKLDLLAAETPERTRRVLSILRSRERVLDLLQPYRALSENPDLN